MAMALIGCMSAQPDFKNLSPKHQQLIEKNIESRLQQINNMSRRDMYRRSFSVANHPSMQRSHSFDANADGPDSGTITPGGTRIHMPRHSGGTLQKVGQMFVKMSPSLVRKKRRGKNLARAVRSELENNAGFMSRDPKVYGIGLRQLLRKQRLSYPDLKVPHVLVMLRKAFRGHLKKEGIFRAAGDANEISVLRRNIDSGLNDDELKLDTYSPFTLADCFKLYFKLMPAPLFPFKTYDSIMKTVKNPDFRPKDLISVLSGLPKENRATLEFLVETMIEVASVSGNRMDLASLAICFSPNLLRPLELTPQIIMKDSRTLHVCLLTVANYHLTSVYGVNSKDGQVPCDLFDQVVARAQKLEAIERVVPSRVMTLPPRGSQSRLDDIDSGDFSDAFSDTSEASVQTDSRSGSPTHKSSARKRFAKLKKSNTLNRSFLKGSGSKSGKSKRFLPRRVRTATTPMPGGGAGHAKSAKTAHKRNMSNQLPANPPSPETLRAHRKTLSMVGDPREALSAAQRAKNLAPVLTAPTALRGRSPGRSGVNERNMMSPPPPHCLSLGRSRGLTLTAVQEAGGDVNATSRARSITRTSTTLSSAIAERNRSLSATAQPPPNFRSKLVSHASSSHFLGQGHGRDTGSTADLPTDLAKPLVRLKVRVPHSGSHTSLNSLVSAPGDRDRSSFHRRTTSLKSPPITTSGTLPGTEGHHTPSARPASRASSPRSLRRRKDNSSSSNSNNSHNSHNNHKLGLGVSGSRTTGARTPENGTPGALSPVGSPLAKPAAPRSPRSPRSPKRDRQKRAKSMFAAPVFFDSDEEDDESAADDTVHDSSPPEICLTPVPAKSPPLARSKTSPERCSKIHNRVDSLRAHFSSSTSRTATQVSFSPLASPNASEHRKRVGPIGTTPQCSSLTTPPGSANVTDSFHLAPVDTERAERMSTFEKLLSHKLGSGNHSPKAVAGGSTRIFEVRRHKSSHLAQVKMRMEKRRSASLPNVFLVDHEDFGDESEWPESEADDNLSSIET